MAAGTTPVSRHQARNRISLGVQAPRRSGSRQASTTTGRTTNMKKTTTTSPRTRWSPSASNGRFMPSVTNTASTAISDICETKPSSRIASRSWRPRPSSSMLPTISPITKAAR